MNIITVVVKLFIRNYPFKNFIPNTNSQLENHAYLFKNFIPNIHILTAFKSSKCAIFI
jgi:hypothetical protein